MRGKEDSEKSETLSHLLKRIDHGEDPAALRQQAHYILEHIAPNDIAMAERNLIAEGYSAQSVQLLSATFMLMGIPEADVEGLKKDLPANHILRIVMTEHDVMRYLLADLVEFSENVNYLNRLTDTSAEFSRLCHIVEHLDAMKEHFDREDDVIFPYLRNQGKISLCRAMEADHIEIRAEINRLVSLVLSLNQLSLEQFKVCLVSISQRLWKKMSEHLCQEDVILYPIALGVINDSKTWKKIKALCDEIGYCGIHL